MGSLAGRCGIPSEEDRVYVGVTYEEHPDGGWSPLSIAWPDGRSWKVQAILSRRTFGRAYFGNLVERVEVKILGRSKTLFRDRTGFFVARPGQGRGDPERIVDPRSLGY